MTKDHEGDVHYALSKSRTTQPQEQDHKGNGDYDLNKFNIKT